ncbi:hypothetical protein RvY_09089-2 [Ramazzottius varieornatus]|nr:hypothetical protein RvY_09089-2 [Ramazzottius varieornatus]
MFSGSSKNPTNMTVNMLVGKALFCSSWISRQQRRRKLRQVDDEGSHPLAQLLGWEVSLGKFICPLSSFRLAGTIDLITKTFLAQVYQFRRFPEQPLTALLRTGDCPRIFKSGNHRLDHPGGIHVPDLVHTGRMTPDECKVLW